MFTYEFIAITKSGVEKKGSVRAKNIDRAKRKVQEKDLYLKSIELNDDIRPQNSFSFINLVKEFFFLNSNKINL